LTQKWRKLVEICVRGEGFGCVKMIENEIKNGLDPIWQEIFKDNLTKEH
jgi:hypothetical protein